LGGGLLTVNFYGPSKGDAKACIIEATERSVSDYKQSLRNRESFSRNEIPGALRSRAVLQSASRLFERVECTLVCFARSASGWYEIIKANCKEVYRDAFSP
jgi:hypothetical protein